MKSLTRYSPFFDLDFDTRFAPDLFDSWLGMKNNKSPRFTTEEDAECYLVRAEIPGYTDKEISVEIDNDRNIITVSGKSKAENAGDKMFCSSISEFRQSYTLPSNIDRNEGAVSAQVQNGILVVKMMKSTEDEKKSRVRKIEIKHE